MVSSTFAYIIPTGVLPSDGYDAIAARLDGFYTLISTVLHSDYDWAHARLKIYNYNLDPPRIPDYDEEMPISGTATTYNNLPSENAIVVSMEGAIVSGVNARRRRGRVYVGPLQMASGDLDLIPTTMVDAFADAAETWLLTPEVGTVESQLAVYSPYTHHNVPVGQKLTPEMEEDPTKLDDSFNPVVRIWVDNAWDTQRRRGRKATTRDIRVLDT